MTVPPDTTPTQAQLPPTLTAGTTLHDATFVLWPDPDAAPGPTPERCPTCGRLYALFSLPGSQLLDLVEVAKLALTHLQAAIEEEALP